MIKSKLKQLKKEELDMITDFIEKYRLEENKKLPNGFYNIDMTRYDGTQGKIQVEKTSKGLKFKVIL